MDPNKNLKDQIELAKHILDGEYDLVEAEALAELVIDLNDWIEKGGFLPNAWKAPRRGQERPMNMNRQKPPKDCPDLAYWLSGVIHDAIRDAREAGLDSEMIASMLITISKSEAAHASLSWKKIAGIDP